MGNIYTPQWPQDELTIAKKHDCRVNLSGFGYHIEMAAARTELSSRITHAALICYLLISIFSCHGQLDQCRVSCKII